GSGRDRSDIESGKGNGAYEYQERRDRLPGLERALFREHADIADLGAGKMGWFDRAGIALAFVIHMTSEQAAADEEQVDGAGKRHRNADRRDLEYAEARLPGYARHVVHQQIGGSAD